MKNRIVMMLAAVIAMAGLVGWTACSSQTEASTAEIKLSTIQCGMCVQTVSKALKDVPGVQEAKVDLKAKTATITYMPNKTNVAAREQAGVKAGYAANDKAADGDAYAKLPDCCKIGGGH